MFAGAAFTDQADINADNADAVELLTTLNIISGYPDGSFDPEGTVDRAEMAKMIYTIRNGGNDDASAHVDNTTSFTDINGHWAEGYIKYLQNTGIVAGKSATTFDPDSPVTTTEAMKMALALAGYDEKNAELTGPNWSKNTLTLATTIGLTDNVNSAMTAGCTRQDAAQILANVLSATAVRYSTIVEGFVNDSKEGLAFAGDPISVGLKWMDLWTNIGTLVGIDGDKLTITMTQSDEADSDDKDIKNFIDLDTDYSDLMGQKVKVLFEDGKNNAVIGVFATTDNTVYTVEANDTGRDDDRITFGGESYRVDFVDGGIQTYVDGQDIGVTTLDELDHNTLNPNMYTFVDTDDNGRLDTLVVETYNVAKVTYAASDRIIANGRTYYFSDDTIADDIARDDWVVITRNLYNDNRDIVKADVQTGTLDAMRDNQTGSVYFDDAANLVNATYDEYQIGDTWYNGGDRLQDTVLSENDLRVVRAGDSVDYVAVNGIMFYIQRSTGDGTGRVDNVAMIVDETPTGALRNEVRVAFFNGDTEIVEYDVNDSVAIQEGAVYEYSVSGDEYTFETLKDGVANEAYKEYYGDMTYLGDQTVGTDFNVADVELDNAFEGYTIDDNAQILLFSENTDATPPIENNGNNYVTELTGKQFKALTLNDLNGADAGSPTIIGTAYGFYGSMSGLNRIGALAVQVTNNFDVTDLSAPTWTNYAVIMSDASRIQGTNLIQYTAWTVNGLVNVREEHNTISDRKALTVIGYDNAVAGDGYTTFEDVDALVSTQNIHFSAITDVSDNGNTVQFSNGRELDVSNATILYIDTDKKQGLESGSISLATRDQNSDLLANALYVIDAGDDADLLVVAQDSFFKSDWHADAQDGDGDLYDGIEGGTGINRTIYGGNAVTGTEKTVALAAALPTLQVNQAVSNTIVLNTTNIDDGTAVTAQLTDSTGNTVVTNGTLAVSNGSVSRNSASLTLTGTPANNTTPVYLTVTIEGDKTTFGPFTINAEPSDNVVVVGSVSGNLTYKAAGNITVPVSAMNAFGDEIDVVSIKADGNDTDVQGNFTINTDTPFTNNSGESKTLTITDKGEALPNTYTVEVRVGDSEVKTFTFNVVANTIADANDLDFNSTITADPTTSNSPTDMGANVTAGASSNYAVTSVTWMQSGAAVEDAANFVAGDLQLVIVLTADAGYAFAENASSNVGIGASSSTTVSTNVVGTDVDGNSTLTLTYTFTLS